MLRFNEATLIYVANTKAEDGSPIEISVSRRIQVKEVKTFSLNYYMTGGDSQRIMRNSKNLVVPRWATDDVVKDGITYELMYVKYNDKNYRVQQFLRQFRTNTRVLLDIEELR